MILYYTPDLMGSYGLSGMQKFFHLTYVFGGVLVNRSEFVLQNMQQVSPQPACR